MKNKIIFSVVLTFLFAAVSYGQGNYRLRFFDSLGRSGEQTVNVTYTGLENPNLRIFESLIPVSSDAECHSRTDFPNPRVLGPDEASLQFDRATGTNTVNWLVHIDRTLTCRVLRVGESIDSSDLNVWRSNFGAGGFAEYPTEDARPGAPAPVGDVITFTVTLTNNGPDIFRKE